MTTADWARIIGQGPAWKKVTFTKKRGFEEDMLSYLEGGPEPQGQQAGPNNQSPSESETESSTSEDNDDKELPNQDVQLKNMAYLASSIAARQGNANMHRQMQEEIQRRAAARPEQQNAIPNQQLQPQSHQHQQEQADTNQAIDSNPICSFCRDIVHIDPSGHYKEACPHRWYIKKQPLLEFLEKDMPGNITMIDGTREYPEDLHDIIKEAWRKLQEWVKGHIKKELEPKMRERMQLLQHSNRDDQDPIEESELLRSLLEQCLVGSQASSSVLTRYDPYYFQYVMIILKLPLMNNASNFPSLLTHTLLSNNVF
jgi:hypothetical protein